MGEKYLMIPVQDLRHLELFCKNCQTGVVLDLADSGKGFPKQCPTCGAEFDRLGGLPEILGRYRRFYEDLAKAPVNARFRVKEE